MDRRTFIKALVATGMVSLIVPATKLLPEQALAHSSVTDKLFLRDLSPNYPPRDFKYNFTLDKFELRIGVCGPDSLSCPTNKLDDNFIGLKNRAAVFVGEIDSVGISYDDGHGLGCSSPLSTGTHQAVNWNTIVESVENPMMLLDINLKNGPGAEFGKFLLALKGSRTPYFEHLFEEWWIAEGWDYMLPLHLRGYPIEIAGTSKDHIVVWTYRAVDLIFQDKFTVTGRVHSQPRPAATLYVTP